MAPRRLDRFTTAIFGILLWVPDKRANGGTGTIGALTWRTALLIGLARALALVPGVSRSGITMTMSLFLGLTRAAGGKRPAPPL